MDPASSSQTIAHFLSQTKSPADLQDLLIDLLTPEELISIQQRVEIFQAILAGKPQRQIAEELNCSIATITRGSRVVRYGTGAVKKILMSEVKKGTRGKW